MNSIITPRENDALRKFLAQSHTAGKRQNRTGPQRSQENVEEVAGLRLQAYSP